MGEMGKRRGAVDVAIFGDWGLGCGVPTMLKVTQLFWLLAPLDNEKVYALVKLVISTTSDMPLVTPELNLTGDARVASESSVLRDHPRTGVVVSLKVEFPLHGSLRTTAPPGTANSFSHCADLHRQHGDPNAPSFE